MSRDRDHAHSRDISNLNAKPPPGEPLYQIWRL